MEENSIRLCGVIMFKWSYKYVIYGKKQGPPQENTLISSTCKALSGIPAGFKVQQAYNF